MSERAPATPHAVLRWLPPQVGGGQPARAREQRSPGKPAAAASTAQQAEAAGYAAGLARAQLEVQARLAELGARVERFETLIGQLAQPLRLLDAEVEETLLSLALAIGSQLARRTLHAEPAQLIALVRDCLNQLPLGAGEVRVHLHPEDALVVREKLAVPASESAWRLIEDPTLTRGGCLVESEHSRIDARFESRMNALIAAALGDERAAGRLAPGTVPAPDSAP
jgi:flagellar assembly protein FliH